MFLKSSTLPSSSIIPRSVHPDNPSRGEEVEQPVALVAGSGRVVDGREPACGNLGRGFRLGLGWRLDSGEFDFELFLGHRESHGLAPGMVRLVGVLGVAGESRWQSLRLDVPVHGGTVLRPLYSLTVYNSPGTSRRCVVESSSSINRITTLILVCWMYLSKEKLSWLVEFNCEFSKYPARGS